MSESVCCVCGDEDWVRAKPGDDDAATEAQRWCISCDPTVGEFVSTRSEALDRGLMFYHTGKLCLNGHIAPRYASGGECHECLRARVARQRKSGRRSEIDRAYHDRNRADRNRQSKDFWAKRKAAMQAVT